jgi:hypothetical protein
MKQMLLDMMSAMMPAMMPLVWIGAAVTVLSIVLLLVKKYGGARLGGAATMAFGIFFLACQLAGALLGAQPSINFGDPSEFEFILVPFWQIGLAFLIPGLIVWWVARSQGSEVLHVG